ncbi:c-type cytochrome [Pseudohalocynthiibacter aestuariivivens]|uniref:C-type cytochrome n=1 Tax=Pseudohalocynthiibacter aestuariivivens TaxID=1591409 RepID=A0ABV5JIF5_9RHOB|nr:cytochrome c family protein [Pseudohalocynthiibacter aestuariivivens]MBS9716479.1 c-type cytochrome [Pseudohalocynthiibacter aestuariivivens]
MRITAIGTGLALCLGVYAFPSVGQEISEVIANADPAVGERLFRQCKGCHTVDQGGRNRVGPNLYGVLGRSVATSEGFRYSSALRDFGGEWSLDRLAAFLENPRKAIPGTRMSYRGLSDIAERANIIAFLNTMSNEPRLFSEAGVDAAEGETDVPAEDFGQLVIAEGVEETFYTCTACHSEMIVAQQGKTREGWDELLEWMVEEQGMGELAEADRNTILDYLAEHYNTDRPNFPRP